ncbi:MAG: hypothetical protein ACHQ2Y_00145 [Candidatus Lutacidiplasmatales archaeon]
MAPSPSPAQASIPSAASEGSEPSQPGLPRHGGLGKPFSRLVAYLRARPALCLLLMSPGIPEYLSGSSKLGLLAVNPGAFLLFLGLNLGLYVPGVLLVREACVRWGKGWASILLLGAAYGIVEEGIALNTMFNPNASVVGALGGYGHFDGVNTVWIPGVLIVHMVYSIGLPILLLGLAVPESKGRRLLTRQGLAAALSVLAVDMTLLLVGFNLLAEHFWMGWPIFFGSLAAIALLVAASYYLPATWPRLRNRPPPSVTPTRAGVVGAALLPGVFLLQGILQTVGAPPELAIVAVMTLGVSEAAFAYWFFGSGGNRRGLLGFSLGLLLPIVCIGLLGNFPLELVIVADAAVYMLFRHLFANAPAVESEVLRPGSPEGVPGPPRYVPRLTRPEG